EEATYDERLDGRSGIEVELAEPDALAGVGTLLVGRRDADQATEKSRGGGLLIRGQCREDRLRTAAGRPRDAARGLARPRGQPSAVAPLPQFRQRELQQGEVPWPVAHVVEEALDEPLLEAQADEAGRALDRLAPLLAGHRADIDDAALHQVAQRGVQLDGAA